MKILSFNYQGLANPTKKSSLKRLVDVVSSDVIFLQETLGISESVLATLESLMPSWSFVAVDAKGRSGFLATGWSLKKCNCERVWGFESGIDLNVFSVELGRSLTLVNIYGPYSDRQRYWESLAKCS
jgi:exonuclease III